MSRAFSLLSQARNLRDLAALLREKCLLLEAMLYELRAEVLEAEAMR